MWRNIEKPDFGGWMMNPPVSAKKKATQLRLSGRCMPGLHVPQGLDAVHLKVEMAHGNPKDWGEVKS